MSERSPPPSTGDDDRLPDRPDGRDDSPAAGDDAASATAGRSPSSGTLRARLRPDRTAAAVLAVAGLALLARLLFLGERVAHQDEARVSYWTLRFAVSGRWEYRPIIHGPFLQVVGRHLFAWFGPSDFLARLPVAVVGGLLPAAALLFRGRLRDGETVAFAALLAANPVLLYYSRFMRNDVPLAAFMLVAVGCWVRALDAWRASTSASAPATDTAGTPAGEPADDDGRAVAPDGGTAADTADGAGSGDWPVPAIPARVALYAGGLAFALAFTTKENAALYPVCWLGALAVLADGAALRARARGTGVGTALLARLPDRRRARRLARRAVTPAAALAAEFLAVVVLFYAPRGGGFPAPVGSAGGVGLGAALLALDPGALAAVLGEATLGTARAFYGTWAAGGHQDHPYLPFLGDFLRTLAAGAAVVSVGGVLGTALDRYAGRNRPLVTFAFVWGLTSVLGYPIVTDIAAPWTTVHAVVPLCLPAAVGLAWVYRAGGGAVADGDRLGAVAAAVVLVVAAGYVGYVAAWSVYLQPQSPDNELVQYAQSSSTDLRPVLDDVEAVARASDGVDVRYYGEEFYSPNESAHDAPTAGKGWFPRLPLSWYLEVLEYRYDGGAAGGATTGTIAVDSVRDPDAVDGSVPVVIALGDGTSATDPAGDVRGHLDGYLEYRGHRYLFDSGTPSSISIFVDPEALPGTPRGNYVEPTGTGNATAVPTGPDRRYVPGDWSGLR